MKTFLRLILCWVLFLGCGDGEESRPGTEVDCGGSCSAGQGGGGGGNAGASTESSSSSSKGGSVGSGGTVGGTGTGASPGGTGGTTGAGGTSDCQPTLTCDDGNPCTKDSCNPLLGCSHEFLPDGSSCAGTALCTPSNACVSGECVGVPVTSQGRVIASAFAFGAEIDVDSDMGGGLSVFLSDERLVFADRIDRNTLLTVVRLEGGALHIEAQTLTGTTLMSLPYSAWGYQSFWATHLLPLGPTRFALVDYASREIFVFELIDGQLRELSRTALEIGGEATQDAAVTADGQIWICGMGVHRFRVNAAGGVDKLANVQFNGIRGGCRRIVVAADGKTVYADAMDDVVRWTATDAPEISAEVVLPSVLSLGLAVDEGFIAVQRGKNLGYGDLQLYRATDRTQVESASQTTTKTPFGVGLMTGQYLQLWDHRTEDWLSREQLLKWHDASGTGSENTWVFRRRTEGVDQWVIESAQLANRGRLLLFQPWRRLLKLSEDNSEFEDITGPGHGTIRELVSVNAGTVVTAGPYATHQLSLTDSSINFASGGTLHDSGLQPPLQVVLPNETVIKSSFEGRSLPLQQRAETQSLNLMQATATGVYSLGVAKLSGGPATLLVRDGSLYQIAPTGTDGFRLRRYVLSAGLAGKSEPLVPSLEVNVSVDKTGLPYRRNFTVEIDPELLQAVIVEARGSTDAYSSSDPKSFTWFTWRDGQTQVLATKRETTTNSWLPQVALRGSRVMVFGKDAVSLCQPNQGQFELLASADIPELHAQSVLGLDGATQVYVASSTGTREEVLVFDWAAASLRSRVPLPSRGSSMVRNGDRLVLATKQSVHLIEPTCGDVKPPAATEWPVPFPIPREVEDLCEVQPECQTWEAPTQPGDVNRDGCVDDVDMEIAGNCLDQVADPCKQSIFADLNGNGVVEADDYYSVVEHITEGCK